MQENVPSGHGEATNILNYSLLIFLKILGTYFFEFGMKICIHIDKDKFSVSRIGLQDKSNTKIRRKIQSLYNTTFGVHRNGLSESYEGVVLQRSYRKITILWPFSHSSFLKFCGKKIWEPHDHVILKNLRERSGSVVECLTRAEGPCIRASPASLCYVLEQDTI